MLRDSFVLSCLFYLDKSPLEGFFKYLWMPTYNINKKYYLNMLYLTKNSGVGVHEWMIDGGKGGEFRGKGRKKSESPYSLWTCITLPKIWIERKLDCVSKSQGTLKEGERGPSTMPRKSSLEWNQYTYFKTTIEASDHVDKNRTGLTLLL